MVSIRVYCYLLIFFILHLHAQVSNANFINQALAPQEANNEDTGASTGTGIFSKDTQNLIENRKMLKRVNVKVEANKKNGLAIESKETVKKRLTKTTSLTADYRDPGHHPPRHN